MPDDRTRMSTTPHEERQDEFIDLTASEELADLPFAGGRVIAWRSAWQLPVAFVSIVLIAVGLWTIKQGIVLPDSDALLSVGEQRVVARSLADVAWQGEDRPRNVADSVDLVAGFVPQPDPSQMPLM